MRRAALVLLLAVSCSSSKSSPAPAAAGGNEPAGKVIEVSGDVSATRADGSEARALLVEGQVFADDTVATGPGARVVIRLAHNEVAWSLEENRKRRVDASAAWKAPKGSAAAVADLDAEEGDRTAAAGRHTEREAAETMPAPPSAVEPTSPPPPPPPSEPESGEDREVPQVMKSKPKGAKGGMGNYGTIGRGSGSGTGSGYGSGSGRVGGSSGKRTVASVTVGMPQVKGALPASVVRRIVASNRAQLLYCYEKALTGAPTLAGTMKISFVIAVDGTVSTASVTKSSLGDAAVGDCVVAVIKQSSFPGSDPITAAILPLVFKPN